MTTDCTECGAPAVSVPIPGDLREHAPGDAPAMAVCTSCLSVQPLGAHPENSGDLSRISPEFPDDPDVAAALALLLATIDSIAIYHDEVVASVERLERAGVDPLSALDRLARDPDLDPATDLRRRGLQLEQLLE